MDEGSRKLIHAMRNALNGLTLQLEVASLRAGQGDVEAARRGISGAQGAAETLAELLDSFEDEVTG